MTHNILITGGSGYLGGTMLARWKTANLPAYGQLYALVRSPDQAEAVKAYGAEPLFLNLDARDEVLQALCDRAITIVYYLIDVYKGDRQINLLEGLAQVKKKTGHEVHFLHTGGAKQFSSHVGMPTDRNISDLDPALYSLQRSAHGPHQFLSDSVKVNCDIIDTAEELGVHSYIFVPCAVFGKGEGFGNQVSIQDATIVQAAQKLRQVYKVDSGSPVWPVCHVADTAELYLQLLRKMLLGEKIGSGKNGYYLASSGLLAWDQIYSAISAALARRNIVDSDAVQDAREGTLDQMGQALDVEPSSVPVLLGGKCTFVSEHGKQIGWVPQYAPEEFVRCMDEEVERILDDLATNARASIR
ncbi:hypothetical protein ASPBRDRAFT_70828 [Aspergillus brasiliensis CBS 101740]|uniref:NAD-dependent epimerase/dehydratase domain-containing protein n=1 Tax=Aspergillus brasiliensis (strain CBS 101740 / IMI 381727 / IBT 21946) TaxID=767769 RepID=A0A1L9V0W2_ASPBC|nr:hypothetical protein ASPBRDRAFT_70828 [Aspergillus brasiliensis CBS 101740]